MAIEIPSLAADRLPHPEWGPAAALGRYTLPAGRLLGALEAAAAPALVLDGLRTLAAAGGSVQLQLAADRGLVQILLDGRRIPLTGAARDAALNLLGDAASPGPGSAAPAAAAAVPDAFVAARVAAVDAQVQEARSHFGEAYAGTVETPPPQAAVTSVPLMTAPAADAARAGLARAVETSGLFLEAHVAQWLRGERSLAQLQDEIRVLPPVTGGAHAAASENRANRQLEAQQHQVIHLQAPAWPGQPLELEIARDPERRADAAGGDAAGLFQATLSLQLPRLGMLRARIRLMHDTVGLQLAAEHAAQVAPALQDLAAALAARGLSLAALELAPPEGATQPGVLP